jgi:hypothetical protein
MVLRPLLLIPAFWWIQTTAQVAPSTGFEGLLERYGMPGIALALITALWREDRKSRIAAQQATDERYTALVGSMLSSSTKMAEAVTALTDALGGKVTQCPWSNSNMHGFMQKLLEREQGEGRIT